MERRASKSRRTWLIILCAVAIAVVGVVGLLLSLDRFAAREDAESQGPAFTVGGMTSATQDATRQAGPRRPELTGVEQTAPTEDARHTIVARVDDVPITLAELERAAAVDGVMNTLANQAVVSRADILDSMVNDLLLLREAGLQEAALPSVDVSGRLEQMEEGIGVEDAQVAEALAAAGLSRADLMGRVAHLMLVERAIKDLAQRFPDLNAWLEEKRADAAIWIDHTYLTDESSVEGGAAATSVDEVGD